ncbi:probable serine/threonine-protein kinase At1g01540 isoform X2 [Phoenix dactylifera]|uniref:non-specific serine/threonine protein kinase n=1 Tax=Phoenix dactylifera TaxID=42345 RepID=A0A8B9AH59_PHODC|nr:probable serine/threonine-protein kinase At1g01540 isoform X2 [Phoenix dactylifera]
MSFWDGNFLNGVLSKPTSIFGLKLWVVIGICVGAAIVLVLFLLALCLTSRRRPASRKPPKLHLHDPTPSAPKDIPEIVHHHHRRQRAPSSAAEVQIDIGGKADHRVVLADQHRPPAPVPAPPSASTTKSGESQETAEGTTPSMGGGGTPEVSHLGWGQWYTLREMEEATGGLAEENVIGEGAYGTVYRGVLADCTVVAIKNLLNNRGPAEEEFRIEVETIGRARHKNLVRVLGYCAEGAYRMLVYEYADNGNLYQWLHGDVGEVSPLTWDIRMRIILGTAKGLAYLHEGLEPKVVHRDVKSSNILLDQQWNPKVSDFGLAKLLGSERSYVTTRVMGTFGYVAPEYACTGMLNERSDVYSFGVLIMEIISGRTPVDYRRPPREVVDPKMLEEPSPKALKRALLVAVRCVDPDAQKRPKIGHVVYMLEMDELLFPDNHELGQEASAKPLDGYNQREEGSFSRRDHQTRWRS